MNKTDSEIASLRNQYHNLIEASSIKDEDALNLAMRCCELTFHIHQRIEYCESRRSQFAIVALSLLAAAVALFATTFSGSMNIGSPLLLTRLTALSLFLTSIITLILYSLQTNFKYPFIEITKTWRWFYHYCVSKKYKPPFLPFERAKRRKEMQVLHLRDMLAYSEKTLKISPKEELEQDLEQLFLVIVNEKYKNLQLTHLRKVISWGLGLSVLIGFVAAISAICTT